MEKRSLFDTVSIVFKKKFIEHKNEHRVNRVRMHLQIYFTLEVRRDRLLKIILSIDDAF